jgi:hypothetical protein
MEKKPQKVQLKVDAQGLINDRPSAVNDLRRELVGSTSKLRQQQREAALVLVWGYAPETTEGQQIARAVSKQMGKGTGSLFKGARTRELWQGGPTGRVELEMFLYEQERTKS